MSGYRGRGRGRGRGWGGGQQNFENQQQHFSDGDMAMSDNREYTPRGRGRGRGRGQAFQQHHQSEQQQPEREAAKSETVMLLEGFLGRRYNADTKLLDLSRIASDEAVLRSGMFENERTQKKFFPALMVVCDTMLPSREQKIAAIDSVSLANNNVPNLNVIYELVKSLNHIKNLDLSGNAFATLGPLKPWKNRYKSLEHLVVDPFPEIGWEEELVDWFPRLRFLNGKEVRPDPNAPQAPVLPTVNVSAPAPNNFAPTPPQLNPEEHQKKEEMIAFVQQATNLNRDYAVQCLEAGNWDLQQASDLFAQSKATLPPGAFV
jgi:nuclear RNA export factor